MTTTTRTPAPTKRSEAQCLRLVQEYTRGSRSAGRAAGGESPDALVRLQELQAQRAAIVAARLARPGVLVLNDPVGTGKTVVALAAAALLLTKDAQSKDHVERIVVVAPNKPCADMWRKRAGWLGCLNASPAFTVATMRTMEPTRVVGPEVDRAKVLVIVDEAHRGLHNEEGSSYAKLRELARGARVMLVTATPFQLTPSGLSAMLEVDGNHDPRSTGLGRAHRIKEYASSAARWLTALHDREFPDGTQTTLAADKRVADAERVMKERLEAARPDLQTLFMPAYPLEQVLGDTKALALRRGRALPIPHHVPMGDWATTYHVARLIPDLTGNTDATQDKIPGNSDSYVRKLVSSIDGWRTHRVCKMLTPEGSDEPPVLRPESEMARLLCAIDRAFFDESELPREDTDQRDHPKVAATAQLAARAAAEGHHVLVFCVFVATQPALVKAIKQELEDRGICADVEGPEGPAAAENVRRSGFGRPVGKGAGKTTHPIIMVVRDNLSESVDLDGGQPVVIHHDLSWSPVRWIQRIGRVVRAPRFEPPHRIEVPLLVPDDQATTGPHTSDARLWETLKNRLELTRIVIDPDTDDDFASTLADDDLPEE